MKKEREEFYKMGGVNLIEPEHYFSLNEPSVGNKKSWLIAIAINFPLFLLLLFIVFKKGFC